MSRWDNDDGPKDKRTTSFLFSRNRIILLTVSWCGIGFLFGFLVFSV